MPDLIAEYGSGLFIPAIPDRDGDLWVYYGGSRHLATELVIDGHRFERLDFAPTIIPANHGIVADLVATNSTGAEITWSPPVVGWRIDRIGGYGEAWIARDNGDGIGPISDVPTYYRLKGFRAVGVDSVTTAGDGAK